MNLFNRQLFMSVACLFLSTAAFASTATTNAVDNRKFICPWVLGEDRQSYVWIGANDKSDPYDYRTNPMYIGPVYGGPVYCDFFSQYLAEHRHSFSKAKCFVSIRGTEDSSRGTLFIRADGVNQLPADDSELNVADIGGGTLAEVRANGRVELRNCNAIIRFVKGYYQRHPKN